MWGWGHDVSAVGWILMTLAMMAFWTLVIAAVVTLLRRFDRGAPTLPIATLEQRFAAGDLTREEFEERRRVLLEASPGTRLRR